MGDRTVDFDTGVVTLPSGKAFRVLRVADGVRDVHSLPADAKVGSFDIGLLPDQALVAVGPGHDVIMEVARDWLSACRNYGKQA